VSEGVLPVLQRGEVPEAIRLLSSLNPDYVDVCTAMTSGATWRSPEEWARAAVESAAGFGGQFVWRVILGLRLQSGPRHVGGWEVAGQGENWITLEASSWFLTAHLVIKVDDEQVSVATLIRYDRAVAALMWTPVSVVHRRAMPSLLRHAVTWHETAPLS
jgi:hypothetical protein